MKISSLGVLCGAGLVAIVSGFAVAAIAVTGDEVKSILFVVGIGIAVVGLVILITWSVKSKNS